MSGPSAAVPAVTYNPSTQCDCWAVTLRIVNLCSRGRGHSQSQGLSPSSTSRTGSQTPQSRTSTSLLSDALSTGRTLVQHWETLNGCASSASHMDPQTLHSMAESISWVLCDYETAVDAMSASETSTQSISMPTPASNSTPSLWNIPRAFVGTVELDDPAEAILVAQEVLSHSIARLTVMLQDIEEEAALQRQLQPNADYELRERDLKELVTRLFRLLGRVNRLGAGTE